MYLGTSLITLAIFVSLSNRVRSAPAQKCKEPFWFNGLELTDERLTIFSTEPREILETSLDRVRLNENVVKLKSEELDPELSDTWDKLVKAPGHWFDKNTMLKRLMNINQDGNYHIDGLPRSKIKTWANLITLKLSNCSPRNTKLWMSTMSDIELANKYGLKRYLELYTSRQYRVCRQSVEAIINEIAKDIPKKDMEVFERVKNIVQGHYENQDWKWQLPSKTWKFADAIAEFLLREPYSYEKLIRATRIYPTDVRLLMNEIFRNNCSLIDKFVGDLLEYIGYIMPPWFQDRDDNISTTTKFWLLNARLCKTLLFETQIHFGVCIRISQRRQIPYSANMYDPQMGAIPAHWLPSYQQATNENPVKGKYLIDMRNPSLVYETDDEFKFDLESEQTSIELIPSQMSPIEIQSWNIILDQHMLHNYLVSLEALKVLNQIHGRQNVKFQGVTASDIDSMVKLSYMKLVNCSPDSVIARSRILRCGRLFNYINISNYIRTYANRQSTACWKTFRVLLLDTIDNLHPSVSNLVKKIDLKSLMERTREKLELNVRSESVFYTMILYFWKENDMQLPKTGLLPSILWQKIEDKFSKPCYFIREALEGYIDYLDKVHQEYTEHNASLKIKSKAWLATARLCKALTEQNFFSDLYERFIFLEQEIEDKLIGFLRENRLTFKDDSGSVVGSVPEGFHVDALIKEFENPEQEFLMALERQTRPSLIEFYELLRQLKHKNNDDYQVKDITMSDIDALIDLKPLRVANCFYENQKSRRTNLLMRPHLIKYPILDRYIHQYTKRQDQICWTIYKDMLAVRMSDFEDDFMVVFSSFIQMFDSNFTDIELEKNIGDHSELIVSKITDFIAKNIARPQGVMPRRDGPTMDSTVLYELLKRTLGKDCFRLNSTFNDYVEYYDEVFGLKSGKTGYLIENPNIKRLLSITRVCDSIFAKQSFFIRVYKRFLSKSGHRYVETATANPFAHNCSSPWKQWFEVIKDEASTSSGPVNKVLTACDELYEDEEDKAQPSYVNGLEFFNLFPKMFSFSSIRSSLMGEWNPWSEFVELSAEERYAWSRIRVDSDPETTYKHLHRISYCSKGRHIHYKEIDTNDVHTLEKIQPPRMINCIDEVYYERKRMIDFIRIKNHLSLKEYVKFYNRRQFDICWRWFELMIIENYHDLPESARLLVESMYEIYDRECNQTRSTDPDCANIVFADFISRMPEWSRVLDSTGGNPPEEKDFFQMVAKVFREPCNFVDDAIGDFIDYSQALIDRGKGKPWERPETDLLLKHGRFCRSILTDKVALRQVYVRMQGVNGPR